MPEVEVRKFVLQVEEVFHEGGPVAAEPVMCPLPAAANACFPHARSGQAWLPADDAKK